LQEYKEPKASKINEKTLYEMVEDVCTFLLKHVIPHEGKYHDHTSTISLPQYGVLTELSRLGLSRKGY
jgi:hypothetical protein